MTTLTGKSFRFRSKHATQELLKGVQTLHPTSIYKTSTPCRSCVSYRTCLDRINKEYDATSLHCNMRLAVLYVFTPEYVDAILGGEWFFDRRGSPPLSKFSFDSGGDLFWLPFTVTHNFDSGGDPLHSQEITLTLEGRKVDSEGDPPQKTRLCMTENKKYLVVDSILPCHYSTAAVCTPLRGGGMMNRSHDTQIPWSFATSTTLGLEGRVIQ